MSSLTSAVFSHSQATANALASIRPETCAAHRHRASASVIEYRTESTARAAGIFSSAACSSFTIALRWRSEPVSKRVTPSEAAYRASDACQSSDASPIPSKFMSASASARQMVPRWSSRRAYCSQLDRGQLSRNSRACATSSTASANRPRNTEIQLRCSRIRWMCNGLPSSRQCLSACDQDSSAASSIPTPSRVSPKYNQHRETSWARLCSAITGYAAPTSRSVVSWSPRIQLAAAVSNSARAQYSAQPRRCARAAARCSHCSPSSSRPVSTQNRPYAIPPATSSWSASSELSVKPSMTGMMLRHNAAARTCRSSSHNAVAHRMAANVDRCRRSACRSVNSLGALVALQRGQLAGGVFVIPAGGGQPDPQEAGPQTVVGDHVLDFGGPVRRLRVAPRHSSMRRRHSAVPS